MGWGNAVAAGVNFVAAERAAGRQSKLNAMQEWFNKQYLEIAQRQIAIAEERWDRFKELYGPVEQILSEELQAGPRYEEAEGRVKADVEQAYLGMRGERQREMGRYGLDPSMGRYVGAEDEDLRDKAKLEVLGKNIARQQEEDKLWARRQAFMNMGMGIPSQSAATLGSAGRAYSAVADVYGQRAAEAGREASAGYGAAGYGAGRATSGFIAPSRTGGGGTQYGMTEKGEKYYDTGEGPTIPRSEMRY